MFHHVVVAPGLLYVFAEDDPEFNPHPEQWRDEPEEEHDLDLVCDLMDEDNFNNASDNWGAW